MRFLYIPNPPLRNALYKNNRDGTFTDVTEKAGVAAGGFGQGVAVGDYDRDGFQDLYVTQYGRSILYHNNGDGTFTDVTEKAGVGVPGWASSAVWFDYDNDGLLDLFVGQFVEFSKELNKPCGVHEDGRRHYCIPQIYQADAKLAVSQQRRWDVHRRFEIVGHSPHLGKVWGVVATDINNDGRMDLFVDATTPFPIFCSSIRARGNLTRLAREAGVAFGGDGQAAVGNGR